MLGCFHYQMNKSPWKIMKFRRADECTHSPSGSPRLWRWQSLQVIAVGEMFDGMSRVKKQQAAGR
jgi:hypothetical protein